MARSGSSQRWLQEHFSDHYVQEAQKRGLRSRAAFKLLQIQEKDHLIRSGMTVVDLGAAPGGWTQVVSQLTQGKCRVVALDILPMDPFEDVTFIEGDFTEEVVYQQLLAAVENQPLDLILSDMAPNMSGNRHVDQPKMMYLLELVLDFAEKTLAKGGTLLVKAFHGEGFDEYLKELRQRFSKVVTRKPAASRSRSSEVYLLAQKFKG